MVMPMRIEYLSYLLEISKHSSLTAASENLYISPQALSQAMKNFEDELGLTLLTRTNRGIKLTKHGEMICLYAQEVMAGLDKINKYCMQNQPRSQITGDLRIASSPACSMLLLPQVLLELTSHYQNIHVITSEKPTVDIIDGILSDICDVGIINASPAYLYERYHDRTELIYYEVLLGRLGIICSEHSPIYTAKNVSWKKACRLPMIISVFDNLETFNVYGLHNQHQLPAKVYNYSNINLSLDTILRTDFVGIGIDKAQQYLSERVRQSIRIVPLQENIVNGIYVLCKQRSSVSDTINAFLASLKKCGIHYTDMPTGLSP